MQEQLLEVLREKAYVKKPTVDELKAIEGLEEINGKLRDEAWATYQAELAAAKTESDKNDTTITTDTTKQAKSKAVVSDLTHRVTVKKDGFRRCGRAWSGTQEVHLSDDDASVLETDPMFVVVAL